ncbi:MAG: PEP-CTERM sorting domain-containing protein [Phycisphaerales bacterium JB063]
MSRNMFATVAVPALTLAASAFTVQADPIDLSVSDPGLSGAVTTDLWTDLTAQGNPGYGGFPGSGLWPGPIQSQAGSTTPGGAGLVKVSNGSGGGPYPAGSSIYYGGFSADINNDGGTLSVQDNTPLADVENVVFQIQIGEAWTFDFLDEVLPTLTINGTTTLSGESGYHTLIEQFDNGTVTMPTGEETVYINTWLVQWDLSSFAEEVTSLEVTFTGVQHAQLYQLRLDQSDSYSLVPEPGSLALIAAGGAMFMRRRRR